MTAEPLQLDSMTKYALMSMNCAHVYLRSAREGGECIWDHAAGVALLRAAGGHVTDMNGKQLQWLAQERMVKNEGIIACSTPEMHELVMRAAEAVKRS